MKPLPKGATIGLLGGGQLGRMIAQEGKPLGFSFACYDPVPDGPAAQVCGRSFVGRFDDEKAGLDFASACDLITFEWENVPAPFVDLIASKTPVRPGASVLRVIQDRLVQREFLRTQGLPQTDYRGADDLPGLVDATAELGFPCILKTRRHGYDGKGQRRLLAPHDELRCGDLLRATAVLEKKVEFTKEISVILARTEDGKNAIFPVAENVHRNGILHTTRAPADIPEKVAEQARNLAVRVADALGFVGVMAVEMFWSDADGSILINEIAPRVHNSGHYTLGACATSQFEQHVRAIAGLPLGPTAQKQPAVMINLLGDLWKSGEPDWKLAERAGARVFLYGKKDAKPGRKMGHLLFLGDAPKALAGADALLAVLSGPKA